MVETVILTGATGTVGALLTQAILTGSAWHLVLPIRPHRDADAVKAGALMSCQAAERGIDPDRVTVVPCDLPHDRAGILRRLKKLKATRIVHAAGCVHYFDVPAIESGNIALTEQWLELAQALRVDRFDFVSSAFCSGYRPGTIAEELHDDPEADPTAYTGSKRRAERLVAESGHFYGILRPSVIIGDSQVGGYRGRNYGIYQLLKAWESVYLDRWREENYFVASGSGVPLIHQDHFMAMSLAFLRADLVKPIVHVVSEAEELPTSVDLIAHCARASNVPRRLIIYERFSDAPLSTLERRHRTFLTVTKVNQEIANATWRFSTENRDALLARTGSEPPETTIETACRCIDAYFAASARLRQFRRRYGGQLQHEMEVKRVYRSAA